MANDYYDRFKDSPKKVAALVYFKEGTDIERVRAWVAKLEKDGHSEGATVREYQEAFGSPVWYIP